MDVIFCKSWEMYSVAYLIGMIRGNEYTTGRMIVKVMQNGQLVVGYIVYRSFCMVGSALLMFCEGPLLLAGEKA